MGFKFKHLTKAIVHRDNGGHTRVLGVKIGHDLDPIVKPAIVAVAVATCQPGIAAAAVAVGTSVAVDHSMGVPDNKLVGSAVSTACPIAGVIINHENPVNLIVSSVVGATVGVNTGSVIAASAASSATVAAITGDNVLRAGLQGAGTVVVCDAATSAVHAVQDAIAAPCDDIFADDDIKAETIKETVADTIKETQAGDIKETQVKTIKSDQTEQPDMPRFPTNKHAEFVHEKNGIRVVGQEHAVGAGTRGADGVARDVMICQSDYENGACVRYQETVETPVAHPVGFKDLYHGNTIIESNPCFTVKTETLVSLEGHSVDHQRAVEVHVSQECKYVPAAAAVGVAITYVPEAAAVALGGTLLAN